MPSAKPTQRPSIKPATSKLNRTKATIYTVGSTKVQLKATVSKKGIVTGVKVGSTIITVKSNGITKKVKVKVIK